ncbi:hypothetical protein GCM10007276_24530 [Agaricicola taiwanensis]|uniref:DUF6898 domain-containing protein n=1 Tax=Agaricicola taiwanensis TaxID=591372 RepID=A0A8J2YJB7_9RHOB|nr:serine hydroxymethyltransferase [Agaricicola taiwanensis]GGE46401.1 hypothetical protein GCM10007276_24530 [Agaricicola taiwanensis]
MTAEETTPELGEVFFEFVVLGLNQKVTAIHGATATEVTVVGPAHAHRPDLQRLALNKLRRRLASG